jgi:hypothetical protein
MMIVNFAVLLTIGFALFYPAQLPIVYNEPFPVYPKEIRKGETLSVVMEVNKRKPYVVDVHKNIICEDGNLVTLTHTTTNIPLGKNTLTAEIIIPAKASFSTCHVEFENTYEINPLRMETQKMITQDFKIIP